MSHYPTLSAALLDQKQRDRQILFIEGKHDQRTLGYAELYDRASMLLFDFQETGMRAGDQLIILHKNNQTFIEAFWACVLGGIIPVPVAVGINDEHRGKLFRIFNKLERPHLYTSEDTLERLQRYAEQHNLQESLAVLRHKTLLANLIHAHGQRGRIHNATAADLCFIQFSSGSTSEPKGVMLSHANIINNLEAIAAGANYTSEDISLSWMPLTHDMGLLGFHLNMIVAGMSQCLMPTDLFSRRPLLWMEKVSECKATVTCSPNFGYKHYLKALGDKTLDGLDLSRLRVIYNGAEPISVELCEQFLSAMAKYKLRRNTLFTVYGLAEATLAVAFPPVGQEYRKVFLDRHAMRLGDRVRIISHDDPNAVGFAIEGRAVRDMQVKITAQDNHSLPAFAIGQVQIKGPSVTHGYYLDEESNRQALTAEGWLNTGDLGFLTEQHELVITGRHKDIIFANGLNYYPHDIEAVALQLPELELGKVVACGVRRDRADADELILFVLFRAGLADFVGIARDITRHVNQQTGLEVCHVIPVQRIPKTTSGKLQRRLLGDGYAQGEYDAILAQLQLLLSEQSQLTGMTGLTASAQTILQLCHHTLQHNTLAATDNFFEVGISSLTLTEIHQRIDEIYPGVVDVTDLFEYQTVIELARFIDNKLPGA
ncbi:MAG: non-ribosomal peptide synthetase [Gammaproteobacteria bacterium]|nr:non-ribosomal peptide synthetase [Gammaproteobacteria bacterium]